MKTALPKILVGVVVGFGLGTIGLAVGQPRVGPAANPSNLETTVLQSVTLSCTNEVAETQFCDNRAQCKVSRASCFPYNCDATTRTCASACAPPPAPGLGPPMGSPLKLGSGRLDWCAQGTQCIGGRCVVPNLSQAQRALR